MMKGVRPMITTRLNAPWIHLAVTAAFLVSLGGGSSRAEDPGKLVLSCLEIPFYGHGAGLAVVIETPGGKTFLYDTGSGYPAKTEGEWLGDYNAGRDAVLPFLKTRGIKAIDGVLISHAHYDHFGGLMWLVDHVTVPKLIDAGYSFTPPPGDGLSGELLDYETLRARFRKTPGAYQAAHAGDRLDLGPGLDVEAIFPPQSFFQANPKGRQPGDRPSHYLVNANSLGVRITHGAVRILLPGDVQGHDQIELLLPNIAAEKLRCDVLVAPAHGIHAEPEFARATRPKVTIASAGGNYAKGSPSPKVYGAVGSRVFVTGIHGRVTVTSDGRSCTVDAERPDAKVDAPDLGKK
jgi:competence protein ComEC